MELGKVYLWPLGRKLALLAILLLVIGPFLPHHIDENESTGEIDAISYMRFISFDVMVFIPFITCILIVLLFYLKVPSFLNKKIGFGNINNIIIIIWGGLFFLIFLNEAFSISHTVGEWRMYPGFGIWIIIVGFLCCSLAGFFEERLPAFTIFFHMEKKNKEKDTEKIPEPMPQTTADNTKESAPSPHQIKEEETSQETLVIADPASSAPTVESKEFEYTEEELRNLTRWSKHIDEHNQAFEQCMKCQNYVFMMAIVTESSFQFTCPECKAAFTLNK
jgi:hypothetical protein